MAMLPHSTQFALDLSAFCRKWIIFIVPVTVFLLWLDARLCVLIYRKYGKRMAYVWLWGVVIFLLIAAALLIVAMFLPRWKMGQLVGPQPPPGN